MTRPLISLLAAVCISSCTAPPMEISGSGDSTFSPSARLSYEFPRRQDETFLQLELDVAQGGGAFEQQLDTFEHVTIGGISFGGPAEVQVSTDVTRVYAGVRFSGEVNERVGGSGLIGVGRSDAEVSGKQGLSVSTARFTGWGPVLGFEGHYRLTPSWRIYLEMVGLPHFPDDADFASLGSFELGLHWATSRHLELVAGWRWWSLDVQSADNDFPVPLGSNVSSDVDLELSGPLLALHLAF